MKIKMMIVVHKKSLLLVISVASTLLHCCLAQETCSKKLANTVVNRGSSSSFPNLYPDDNVQWQVGSSNDVFQSLVFINDYGSSVNPDLNSTYAVNDTQLTILNATATLAETNGSDTTAGLYLATFENTQCTAGAGLTVVETPPTCGSDTSKLTCSITYANYVQQQVVPIMNWVNSSGNVVKTDIPEREALDTENLGLQRTTSEFTVPGGDSSTYTCVVTFSKPDPAQPQFIADNAPDYNASCSGSLQTTTAATTTTKLLTSTVLTTMTATSTTTKPNPTTQTSNGPSTAFSQQSTTTAALNTVQDCGNGTLENSVVNKGNSFSFTRVVNGQPVQWQVVPSDTRLSPEQSPTKPITNYDDAIVQEFVNTYAVNQSQLTIFNATVAQQENMPYPTAGLYLLSYANREDCTIGAGLTVVENGPVCGIDDADPNKVKATCSVSFANYIQQRIVPIMTWVNSSGNIVKTEEPSIMSLDVGNPGLQNATSEFPIAVTYSTRYECQLTFSVPDVTFQPTFIAPNAPSYKASCYIMYNVTTTTVVTKAATTTTTATSKTGTTAVYALTTQTQVTPMSTNPPITNTEVTPSNTPTTTVPLQTGTVGSPRATPISIAVSVPVSTVSQSGSTVPLSSFSESSGATGSMPSSFESASPAVSHPSTGPNEQSTVSTLLPTTISQQWTGSSSSAPWSLSTPSAPVSLSSATTSKAPSLTTAAFSNSPKIELVTDDLQAQATSIVLGLVLGSLVTTALVSACWCYCCFFPIGAKGAKRRKRILLVRRKFLFWRNEPPVEDIYRRSYSPVGRTLQSREPVAPENPWRYPAMRKTFHWREPNENGNFWRWDPAANDPYSRRDFNAIET